MTDDNEQLQDDDGHLPAVVKALDTSNVGTFVLDDEFSVVWINQSIEQFFDVSRTAVIGADKPTLIDSTLKQIFERPDRFAERVQSTYEDNTRSEQFECHILPSETRSERWLLHRSAPIEEGQYAGGRIEHYADISDRKALEQEFRTFREAVENAGSSIYWTDQDGTIEYVNPTFEETTGYTAEEAIGKTPRILKSGAHDTEFYADLWSTILDGEVWQGELTNERANGEQYTVNQTIAPIKDHTGEIDQFVAINQDITERNQREQALETSKKKFQTIFEHANDAIFIVDIDNDSIVDCNPAAAELVEYSREELLSMPASDLHPHNISEFMDFADTVFEQGHGWTDDVTCYCKTGDIIPAHMSASVIELDGRPHLVNHIRDITDREERDWFEGLIDNSNDLITILKSDGTVRYQSPSIDHVLGYNPNDIRDETFFEYIHPDDRQDVREAFDEMTDNSGVLTKRLEYRFRHANGSWAWLESVGSYRPDTTITGYVFNSRDITARKENYQQAAVLNRVLRHNLRNDLNVILGAADLLSESTADDVAKQVNAILRSTSNLLTATSYAGILSEILEAHQLPQKRTEVTSILDQSITRLKEEYPTVEFDCQIPEEQHVSAIPQFDVALNHVLENAIEHNDTDTPRVSISIRPSTSDDGEVEIVIADNGPRIPEQERTVLLEGEETPLKHGSGLGLWIVNWIINRSGGRIIFDKNEPRGSRVTLALPEAD
jgi:PAS domain S-box-containing protein